LIVGTQVFIWTVGGLYMTIINIEVILGKYLIKNILKNLVRSEKTLPISPEVTNGLSEILFRILGITSLLIIVFGGWQLYYRLLGDKA